jgi:XRE family transcriptional regulator, regulator of sulfur utilization
MPTVSEAFSRLLKKERERAELTQEELGYLSGMSRSAIGVLERGQVTPRIDTVLALASALEIDGCKLLPPMRHRMTGGARPAFEWIEE